MLGGLAKSQHLGVSSGVVAGLPFVMAGSNNFTVNGHHRANRNLAGRQSFLGLFKGGGH
jgi:hypothetical protein